jgi:hypothetical protein
MEKAVKAKPTSDHEAHGAGLLHGQPRRRCVVSRDAMKKKPRTMEFNEKGKRTRRFR